MLDVAGLSRERTREKVCKVEEGLALGRKGRITPPQRHVLEDYTPPGTSPQELGCPCLSCCYWGTPRAGRAVVSTHGSLTFLEGHSRWVCGAEMDFKVRTQPTPLLFWKLVFSLFQTVSYGSSRMNDFEPSEPHKYSSGEIFGLSVFIAFKPTCNGVFTFHVGLKAHAAVRGRRHKAPPDLRGERILGVSPQISFSTPLPCLQSIPVTRRG